MPQASAISVPVQRVPSPGGQRHHALGDLRAKRRYARRPGLVAQQARDAFLHVPLLPAPAAGLRLAGPAHNLVGTETLGSSSTISARQACFFGVVAALKNRLQKLAVRRFYSDGNASSPPADSHVRRDPGIPFGYVRQDPLRNGPAWIRYSWRPAASTEIRRPQTEAGYRVSRTRSARQSYRGPV